jgi:outer membrane protein OmpA-like peptidoglycan-associated protein
MRAGRRLAAIVAAVVALGSGIGGDGARAESGRLNFHANLSLTVAAAPVSLGVMGNGGFDWQFHPPFAIDVSVGGGNVGLFGGVMGDTNLFVAALGLRMRFRDHHDGYFDERGGDLWGNWYVVPRLGYLQNVSSGESFGTAELEAGYEFSIARPLQIGPFARAAVAYGTSDFAFAYFLAGINFSVELVRFPAKPKPKPRPRVLPPIEGPDDDAALPDSDGDGVADLEDACPDTRPHSKVDARGCAILAREMVLDGITFAFDSAEIQPESEDALIHAAQALRDNPTARVEIDGHTDDIGTDEYNLKLSEERALAVATWLVAHGIDDARLTVHGFGNTRPKAPNDSEANRALNRRIEFKRLDE